MQLVKWNTDTDTFESGDWFRGTIFVESCDLSPDGRHFIYCVREDHPSYVQPGDLGTLWTAISRPPFFTPLAKWKAVSARDGGGTLASTSELLLNRYLYNTSSSSVSPDDGHVPESLTITPSVSCDIAVFNLTGMLLGGWDRWKAQTSGSVADIIDSVWAHKDRSGLTAAEKRLRDIISRTHQATPYIAGSTAIFTKNPITSPGSLRLILDHKDTHWDYYYTLFDVTADHLIPHLRKANWADWDHQERLVYTYGGQLYEACPGSTTRQTQTIVADFRFCQPKDVAVPGWASEW